MREYIIKIDHDHTKGMQKLVRCKDCAHWYELKDSDPARGVCKRWHMLHHGGWFCADGERMETQ